MAEIVLERRRTALDVVLALVLLGAGVLILGDVVVATAVSVLFLGWVALISGLILFVGSLFRIGSGGFWSAAIGGALLAVIGLIFLRNPLVGALTLTLIAGSLFLVSGLVRIVASFQVPQARWALLLSGLISAGLGLLVLFNLVEATLTLLGILLGIQAIVEGITLLVVGRVHSVETPAAAS